MATKAEEHSTIKPGHRRTQTISENGNMGFVARRNMSNKLNPKLLTSLSPISGSDSSSRRKLDYSPSKDSNLKQAIEKRKKALNATTMGTPMKNDTSLSTRYSSTKSPIKQKTENRIAQFSTQKRRNLSSNQSSFEDLIMSQPEITPNQFQTPLTKSSQKAALNKSAMSECRKPATRERKVLGATTNPLNTQELFGFMDEYFIKNGYYQGAPENLVKVNIKKESNINEDTYCQNMEELLDANLEIITTKNNEKREKEIENGILKMRIDEAKEENEKAADNCKKIVALMNAQIKKNNEAHKENQELHGLLEKLKAKSEEKKVEMDTKLEKMIKYKTEMTELIGNKKTDLRIQKEDIQCEKQAVSSEMKELEAYYHELDKIKDSLKRKVEFSKQIEKQRMRVLLSKSKLLQSAIAGEPSNRTHHNRSMSATQKQLPLFRQKTNK